MDVDVRIEELECLLINDYQRMLAKLQKGHPIPDRTINLEAIKFLSFIKTNEVDEQMIIDVIETYTTKLNK